MGDGDVTLPGICYESHFCCYVGVETSSHQTRFHQFKACQGGSNASQMLSYSPEDLHGVIG